MQIIALAGFLALCLSVCVANSGMMLRDVHLWYVSLTAPPLCPPDWIFAPVSLCLGLLIAFAAWLIWRQPDVRWAHHRALTAWGWQLAISTLWTPLFFGLHLVLPALAVSVALFAGVFLTVIKFRPLNRTAAVLMLPSLVWIGFSVYLNAGFWWLDS